jgi:hypothetical protein
VARQRAISPAHIAHLESLLASGIRSKSALLRSLTEAGLPLNWRTLARWLAERGKTPSRPAYAGFAPPEPILPPADLEARVDASLDSDDDDVATLARHARDVRAALAAWAPRVSLDPTAARTYATLSRLFGDLAARLAELRPKPEVERERLEALGLAARTALLERALANAAVDWQARCARLQRIVDQMG